MSELPYSIHGKLILEGLNHVPKMAKLVCLSWNLNPSFFSKNHVIVSILYELTFYR